MPSGAAVIRYAGKRGVVWRIKYADATGRQVMETFGPEREGWNGQRAERELGKRLDRVERERYRKPRKLTFAVFAARFLVDYLPGRNLKPSTVIDYEGTIGLPGVKDERPARHLAAFFGRMELAAIEPADVDAYIAAKTGKLSPKTIANHLGTLRVMFKVAMRVMFKVAMRWNLVGSNPVAGVEPPRVESPEMQVLSEAEIARLLTAYRELEAHATAEARLWWSLTRRITAVALGTALRRGELLALRWRDVELLERRLTVCESLVRGRFQTPKSRSSRRTIELGPRTASELQEQWQASLYRGDGELVFGHPQIGTPLDPSKLSRDYMRPALKRAKIEKPFRVWHDLRHTALTHEAAAGNPQAYLQFKAGHSQGSITERYIHAAQVLFPGAAGRGEARIFGPVDSDPVESPVET
jgi:integrase